MYFNPPRKLSSLSDAPIMPTRPVGTVHHRRSRLVVSALWAGAACGYSAREPWLRGRGASFRGPRPGGRMGIVSVENAWRIRASLSRSVLWLARRCVSASPELRGVQGPAHHRGARGWACLTASPAGLGPSPVVVSDSLLRGPLCPSSLWTETSVYFLPVTSRPGSLEESN